MFTVMATALLVKLSNIVATQFTMLDMSHNYRSWTQSFGKELMFGLGTVCCTLSTVSCIVTSDLGPRYCMLHSNVALLAQWVAW